MLLQIQGMREDLKEARTRAAESAKASQQLGPLKEQLRVALGNLEGLESANAGLQSHCERLESRIEAMSVEHVQHTVGMRLSSMIAPAIALHILAVLSRTSPTVCMAARVAQDHDAVLPGQLLAGQI